MKKLANHYKVILEITDPNSLGTQDTGEYNIGQGSQQATPDAPPGWMDRFHGMHPWQTPSADENFGGWGSWDGSGNPPSAWPWLFDPNGRVPPVPYPPFAPPGWPPNVSWPPPIGHDYYRKAHSLLELCMNTRDHLAPGVRTAEDLFDWLYEHRHLYQGGGQWDPDGTMAYLLSDKFRNQMWGIAGMLLVIMRLREGGPMTPEEAAPPLDYRDPDGTLNNIFRQYYEDRGWQYTSHPGDESYENPYVHGMHPWGWGMPGEGTPDAHPPDGWVWDVEGGHWRYIQNPAYEQYRGQWRLIRGYTPNTFYWDRENRQWIKNPAEGAEWWIDDSVRTIEPQRPERPRGGRKPDLWYE